MADPFSESPLENLSSDNRYGFRQCVIKPSPLCCYRYLSAEGNDLSSRLRLFLLRGENDE